MRFKQFLENTLDRLPLELFFSHVVGLPKDEVEEAVNWFDGPLDLEGANTEFFDHVIDYLEDDLESGEKRIYDTRGRAGIENEARARLKKRMRKMGALDESKEPLASLQIDMFFRHELKLPKLEAREAALWMEDEKDWGDLDGDTRDLILTYMEDHVNPNIYRLASGNIEQHTYDELRSIMQKKYDIDVSTPFMKQHGL